MPGNRAVAFSKAINYSLVRIKKIADDSLAKNNDLIIIAKDLVEDVAKNWQILEWRKFRAFWVISLMKLYFRSIK